MKINLDPFHIHHWDESRFWASRGCRILVSDAAGNDFQEWGRVSRHRAGGGNGWRRFSRRRIHDVIGLRDDHALVVVRHHILVYAQGKLLWDHRVPNGSRPLPSGICVLGDGRILYGEYGPNPERKPVHLYLSENGGRNWDAIWASEPGMVRHIHMIRPVPGNGAEVYVATGDFGVEPGLFRLDVDTGQVDRLGGGSQPWRMLGLIALPGRLIWGSDCESGDNHIFELRDGERIPRKIHQLPGPAYGACRDRSGGIHISTAVEKPGSHRACIFSSGDGDNWRMRQCFQKDLLPPYLFGYGIASFVRGQQHLERLHVNLRGLRRPRREVR